MIHPGGGNIYPQYTARPNACGAQEAWSGYLDDVATWTRALPAAAISGLAAGTYSPGSTPTAVVTTGGTPPVPTAVVFPKAATTPLTRPFGGQVPGSFKPPRSFVMEQPTNT